MHLRRALVFITLLVTAVPATVLADEATLQRMLRMIPEDPETYKSVPLFDYVDFRALERAANLTRPESENAFATLPESVRAAWIKAYKRLRVGGGQLWQYGHTIGTRKITAYEALGFDWFAIDSAATFLNNPPRPVHVLAGGSSLNAADDMELSLLYRGFVLGDLDGVPVWHRFADNVSVNLRDDMIDGDLFLDVNLVGERIATLPGFVVASHTWKTLRPTIAAANGKTQAAAVSAVLGPLFDALKQVDGTDGSVLQAIAMALPDVGLNVGIYDAFSATFDAGNLDDVKKAMDDAEKNALVREKAPPLAPYPLVLLADMQTGTEQVAVMALPYAERADAEAAAGVVANRLRQWQPYKATRPLVDEVGGKVESKVVEAAGLGAAVSRTFVSLVASVGDAPWVKQLASQSAGSGGGAVALVIVRYPLPQTDAVEPGKVLASLVDAVYDRDLKPLAVP